MTDDDDDSMAANPEPPRRRGPPRDAAGHWVPVWRETGSIHHVEPTASTCRTCGALVALLHSMGADHRREHCGACQGAYNRARMPRPMGGQ